MKILRSLLVPALALSAAAETQIPSTNPVKVFLVDFYPMWTVPGLTTPNGVMVSVCTNDPGTAEFRLSLTYRKPDGSEGKRVDNLTYLGDYGWARCASVLVPVERRDFVTLSAQELKAAVEVAVR